MADRTMTAPILGHTERARQLLKEVEARLGQSNGFHIE